MRNSAPWPEPAVTETVVAGMTTPKLNGRTPSPLIGGKRMSTEAGSPVVMAVCPNAATGAAKSSASIPSTWRRRAMERMSAKTISAPARCR